MHAHVVEAQPVGREDGRQLAGDIRIAAVVAPGLHRRGDRAVVAAAHRRHRHRAIVEVVVHDESGSRAQRRGDAAHDLLGIAYEAHDPARVGEVERLLVVQ